MLRKRFKRNAAKELQDPRLKKCCYLGSTHSEWGVSIIYLEVCVPYLPSRLAKAHRSLTYGKIAALLLFHSFRTFGRCSHHGTTVAEA